MNRIKLLHFVYNLNQGGAETLVKDYALLIDKEKFDIVLLCHDRIGSPYERILQNAGVRVLFISDYFPFKKIYFNHLVNYIICHSYLDKLIARFIVKKENPDIIHSHLLCNQLIKFTCLGRAPKIFHTVHSQPQAYWCTKSRFGRKDYKAVSYLIKKYGMRLIALNEPMRQELNQMFHVSDTVVLNNGIDFGKFNVAESKEIIRKELNIAEDAFLVGHVGRFVQVKNHVLIVDAFKELRKINKKAHLILVGTGELRSQIEEKIDLLGLKENVTILESRTDIPNILKALDMFIFPSHFEGLGIALIEAQKMGIPCVISSAIPQAAVVSNLVYRMPQNSTPEEWANVMENFSVNNIEYYGIEKWDMNSVVKQLECLYERGSFQ